MRQQTTEAEVLETAECALAPGNEESSSISKKPERVILMLTYLDGEERKEALFGPDVPDLEDWEDMADHRWLKEERSKHGPLVLIRMIDETGRPYLRDLRYEA